MSDIVIIDEVLTAIDEYDQRSKLLQEYHFEGNPGAWGDQLLRRLVNDDLMMDVPIYDMLNRRYAAFSSFTEAIWHGPNDPKGNGLITGMHSMPRFSWFMLFYLFRLCGSGINYKPKKPGGLPFKTHGFGNFWVIDEVVHNNEYDPGMWISKLEKLDKPFTDNKGYLLPQFSFKHLDGGHLKHFIVEHSADLVLKIDELIQIGIITTITGVVDEGNKWLVANGFKKQNFVLSAFAADLAEYFPHLIDPTSMIYAGTNAKSCIRAIFKKPNKMTDLKFESEAIQFLADRYGANPMDVEDSRLCDVVRYFKEYQSKDHIAMNGGKIKENNCILKLLWDEQTYADFASKL